MSKGNPDAPRQAPVQIEQRCAVCEGRGQVPPDFYADQRPLVASHVPCRRCEGRGTHAPLLLATPGDTIIVSLPDSQAVSRDELEYLTRQLRDLLPCGVRGMVLMDGATVQVMRPAPCEGST